MLRIDETRRGSAIVLSLEGRLDTETSKTLEARWTELIEQRGRGFVVECSGLAYISSAGLRVFLLAAKQLKDPPGRIVVCGLSDHIGQLFSITGFSKMFSVHASLEEALAALEGAS